MTKQTTIVVIGSLRVKRLWFICVFYLYWKTAFLFTPYLLLILKQVDLCQSFCVVEAGDVLQVDHSYCLRRHSTLYSCRWNNVQCHDNYLYIAPDKREYTHIIFLISAWKHMQWILVRNASSKYHNICFRAEIRKFIWIFQMKKAPYLAELFITLLLGSIALTVLVKQPCYIQTKMHRLYWKMTIYGHFSI